ncbi:hypothetical protein ACOSP7_004156 [Xanthoceras sorbifolium]
MTSFGGDEDKQRRKSVREKTDFLITESLSFLSPTAMNHQRCRLTAYGGGPPPSDLTTWFCVNIQAHRIFRLKALESTLKYKR